MTTPEAVQRGSDIFEETKASLSTILAEMPGIVDTVHADGHIGAIKAAKIKAKVAKVVAGALDDIADLHTYLVAEANAATGVDEGGIDLPQPRSGGR